MSRKDDHLHLSNAKGKDMTGHTCEWCGATPASDKWYVEEDDEAIILCCETCYNDYFGFGGFNA